MFLYETMLNWVLARETSEMNHFRRIAVSDNETVMYTVITHSICHCQSILKY